MYSNKMRVDNETMDMGIKPFANPVEETPMKFGIGQGMIGGFNKQPADLTSGSSQTSDSGTNTVAGAAYKLDSDPLYQQALLQGQSQFNLARNKAMFDVNAQTTQASQDRRALDLNAAESRRRLAGNYAARGMAGGAAGALGLAEAEANARQIAAQTSLKDKLAALNQNYLENFGNVAQTDAAGNSTYDWTGTLAGQNYKTQAAQTALTAKLAQYGVM
jgi:hypothetical protein